MLLNKLTRMRARGMDGGFGREEKNKKKRRTGNDEERKKRGTKKRLPKILKSQAVVDCAIASASPWLRSSDFDVAIIVGHVDAVEVIGIDGPFAFAVFIHNVITRIVG